MERLRSILPFDSGVWATGVRSTNVALSVTMIDHPPEVLVDYALNWQGQDFVRAKAAANPGVAFRNEDVMPLADYHQTEIYRRFSRPAGIVHALGTVQADAVTDIGELIFLFRADPAAAFTDAERRVAERLTLHMAAAWRQRQVAHYYETAAGGARSRSAEGAGAVIDGSGLIYAADDNFSLALRRHFPDWEGPTIPPSVLPVFAAADGMLTAQGLDFSLSRGVDRHILTVTSARRANRLTRAETRVARLFAEGLTHSAIALRLGVSQSTIRNQIAAIYRKLDIHSKAELARMVPPASRP
ncbi:MAG: helix-turn-helix transcriptional regulator [Pseudomonadota bacterium]